MLAQLFALLQDGDLHTSGELAAALNVSRELVAEMLADLARHGYLSSVSTTCSTARCTTCPLNKTYQPAVSSGGRVYTLKSK